MFDQLIVSLNNWHLIQNKAKLLGFLNIAATDCDLSKYIPYYDNWIKNNYHGTMHYMTSHGDKRFIPEKLVDNTTTILCLNINYLTKSIEFKNIKSKLKSKEPKAKIAQYALGRDYHKLIRKKLQKLATYITELYPEHRYRVFTDSAPVLEKPLAEKAGLGWIGKNGNLINIDNGSFFFIGIIYSNLKFPIINKSQTNNCSKCKACIKICPTNAIVADKIIDAKRCISYLTIENKGSIPLELRQAIGTRIYGCDDCQLICPFNIEIPKCSEPDFLPKLHFENPLLSKLFSWSETVFLKNTEGSAIRRIGYRAWVRNLSIAIGNSNYSLENIKLLQQKKEDFYHDEMLVEHINWSINQQRKNGSLNIEK